VKRSRGEEVNRAYGGPAKRRNGEKGKKGTTGQDERTESGGGKDERAKTRNFNKPKSGNIRKSNTFAKLNKFKKLNLQTVSHSNSYDQGNSTEMNSVSFNFVSFNFVSFRLV
jgi:hypothetical protein